MVATACSASSLGGTDSYMHPFDAWAGLGDFFFNVLSTLEQNIVALLVELCLMDRLNEVTQSPTFHRS